MGACMSNDAGAPKPSNGNAPATQSETPRQRQAFVPQFQTADPENPPGSIAVFGSYDAGKSTLVRKLWMLYGESFTTMERLQSRRHIDTTILHGIFTLLQAFLDMYPPVTPQSLGLDLENYSPPGHSPAPQCTTLPEPHTPKKAALGGGADESNKLTKDQIDTMEDDLAGGGKMGDLIHDESTAGALLNPLPQNLSADGSDLGIESSPRGRVQRMGSNRSGAGPSAGGRQSRGRHAQEPSRTSDVQNVTIVNNNNNAVSSIPQELLRAHPTLTTTYPQLNSAFFEALLFFLTLDLPNISLYPIGKENNATDTASGGRGRPGLHQQSSIQTALGLAQHQTYYQLNSVVPPHLLFNKTPITSKIAQHVLAIWSEPVIKMIYHTNHTLFIAHPYHNHMFRINNNNNTLVSFLFGYLQRVAASPQLDEVLLNVHANTNATIPADNENLNELVQDEDLLLLKFPHVPPSLENMPTAFEADEDEVEQTYDIKTGDTLQPYYTLQFDSTGFLTLLEQHETKRKEDEKDYLDSIRSASMTTPYSEKHTNLKELAALMEKRGIEEEEEKASKKGSAEQQAGHVSTISEEPDPTTTTAAAQPNITKPTNPRGGDKDEENNNPLLNMRSFSTLGPECYLPDHLFAVEALTQKPPAPLAGEVHIPDTDSDSEGPSHFSTPVKKQTNNVPGATGAPEHATPLMNMVSAQPADSPFVNITKDTSPNKDNKDVDDFSLIDHPDSANNTNITAHNNINLPHISENQPLTPAPLDTTTETSPNKATPRLQGATLRPSVQQQKSGQYGSFEPPATPNGTKLLRPSSTQVQFDGDKSGLLKQPAILKGLEDTNNNSSIAAPQTTTPTHAQTEQALFGPDAGAAAATPAGSVDQQKLSSAQQPSVVTQPATTTTTTPRNNADDGNTIKRRSLKIKDRKQHKTGDDAEKHLLLSIFDASGHPKAMPHWSLIMHKQVKLIYYVISLAELLNIPSLDHKAYGFYQEPGANQNRARSQSRARSSSFADDYQSNQSPLAQRLQGFSGLQTPSVALQESNSVPQASESNGSQGPSTVYQFNQSAYKLSANEVNKHLRKNVLLFTKTINPYVLTDKMEIVVVFSKYDILVKHLLQQKKAYQGAEDDQKAKTNLILFSDIFPAYTGDNFDPQDITTFLVQQYLAKIHMQYNNVQVIVPQSGLVYLNSVQDHVKLNEKTHAETPQSLTPAALNTLTPQKQTAFTFGLAPNSNSFGNALGDSTTLLSTTNAGSATAEDTKRDIYKKEIQLRDEEDSTMLYLQPIARLVSNNIQYHQEYVQYDQAVKAHNKDQQRLLDESNNQK